MSVAQEAEDALVRTFPKARLCASDLPKREYLFQRNRIARNVRKLWPRFGSNILYDTGNTLFFFLMGIGDSIQETMTSPKKRKFVYLFDAWEPQWAAIEEIISTWRNVGVIYFSSKQAARHFRERLPFRTEWCPQAAQPETFQFTSEEVAKPERPIVYNIGRPNRRLREFFDGFCSKYGFEHIVQSTVEGIIYPSRSDFAKAIRRSSVVVVHPRNLDAPEVTGWISPLTARYYEAYHSGGVVCGFTPTSGEFDEVLGGYPFVELKDERSFEQALLHALQRSDVWREAARRIAVEHSWEARMRTILPHLETSS